MDIPCYPFSFNESVFTLAALMTVTLICNAFVQYEDDDMCAAFMRPICSIVGILLTWLMAFAAIGAAYVWNLHTN